MYAGRLVEQGERVDVLSNGSHPYTQGLLRSIPAHARRDQALCEIPGVVPSPREWPLGCRFSTRCDRVQDRCHSEVPGTTTVAAGHTLDCFDVADEVAR
jgi:oligopeptide/dipeptide ABC transporter ATP-binding protein